VCAVRRLAVAIGVDPLVQRVRCRQVQHERPNALSDLELSGLLVRPDLGTTIGIGDRAILELLARARLRRSEHTLRALPFMQNGAFLVFRRLAQLVPEFDLAVKAEAHKTGNGSDAASVTAGGADGGPLEERGSDHQRADRG